jgi:hypothetical protein
LGLFTESTVVEEIKLVKKYKFQAETTIALESEDFLTENQITMLKEVSRKITDSFLIEKLE